MTDIVKRGETGIRQLLEGDAFKAQVAKALPRHLTPDRFIRVACTAIMRTPKLADCDQASFFNALLNLSQLGLEPDGRRAHLIPFENRKRGVTECQLIVDYKGLVELAMRSGSVANIHADVVCEGDEFEYDMGEVKKHKIDFRSGKRGKPYAAYAVCTFKDGTRKAEVMSSDDIEGIRKRSKAGHLGPWVTDWNEMAKKTCFRRLSKWLPLSPEYRDALEADDDRLHDVSIAVPESTAPRPLKRRIAEPVTTTTPEDDGFGQTVEPEVVPPDDIPHAMRDIPEDPFPHEREVDPFAPTPGTDDPNQGSLGESDGETIEGALVHLNEKPTKTGGKKYGICIETDAGNKVWVNTFDSARADMADNMKGERVCVEAKRGRYGLDLTGLALAAKDK
jgi:recombination protein RecT